MSSQAHPDRTLMLFLAIIVGYLLATVLAKACGAE